MWERQEGRVRERGEGSRGRGKGRRRGGGWVCEEGRGRKKEGRRRGREEGRGDETHVIYSRRGAQDDLQGQCPLCINKEVDKI